MNGSSHELSKSAVEDKDKIADDVQSPPPKGPVVPPSASVVQRTQSTTEPTTREELKRRFFDGDKGQPSSLSREVSKESETKEKNVSETTVDYSSVLTSLCSRYFVSRAVVRSLFVFWFAFSLRLDLFKIVSMFTHTCCVVQFGLSEIAIKFKLPKNQ